MSPPLRKKDRKKLPINVGLISNKIFLQPFPLVVFSDSAKSFSFVMNTILENCPPSYSTMTAAFPSSQSLSLSSFIDVLNLVNKTTAFYHFQYDSENLPSLHTLLTSKHENMTIVNNVGQSIYKIET